MDIEELKQSPAENAAHQAEQLVTTFLRGGRSNLSFDGENGSFKELTYLPWNITQAEQVNHITIAGTKVRDILPLTQLPNLISLDIRNSEVEDLRPVLAMRHLHLSTTPTTTVSQPALQYSGCKATKLDPNLKKLSEIDDDKKRYLATVRYLSMLPAYPAFLPYQEEETFRKSQEKIVLYSRSVDELGSLISGLYSNVERTRKENEKELNKQLSSGREKLKEFASFTAEAHEELGKVQEELEVFQAKFTERVAQKAPIELWAEKQTEHETQQQKSFWWFIGGLGLTAAIAIGVLIGLVLMPQDLQVLLSPPGCNMETGSGCSGLGLRGTLMIGALLSLFTVSLWFTRLQMKLYLAERHMRLDAREREAFTKAYIGLLSVGDTSEEAAQQRALVYGALFRPGSDGTVKDDGGFDPAISAAVSKLLSR